MSGLLRRVGPSEVGRRRAVIDPETMSQAVAIVEDVRTGGEAALRRHSERLGDTAADETLVYPTDELEDVFGRLEARTRDLLERTASRIRRFAEAQRTTLHDLDFEVTGGRGGHRWVPVESVGAYAPGGRHPLPSSVLMTVVPARVAGVGEVWVASPRPTEVTMAAAWVAGADGLLAVGGAQAIAALAFGTASPACDLIVGPGNRWVTAAKKHLFGEVGIDGLAGPSELVVIADDGAHPVLIAVDLAAQAEHDPDAVPILITVSDGLADRVDAELGRLLDLLSTGEVVRAALDNGFVCLTDTLEEAAEVADHIAPEHLALHVTDPETLASSVHHYGSLFLGSLSAEAFADYGAGPNHVLPTGGSARYRSGLSVTTFLNSPTWIRIDQPHDLIDDVATLARLEGLEAHAQASILRGMCE